MASGIKSPVAGGRSALYLWRRLRASLRRARSSRLVALLGTTAIVMFLVFSGMALWYLRTQAVAGAERELSNLNRTLSEQTARAFQNIDRIARDEQERLGANSGPATPGEIHARLKRNIFGAPQIGEIFFVDEKGRVAYSSNSSSPPGRFVGTHPFFLAQRDAPGPGPHISEVEINPAHPDRTVWLSRRAEKPGGGFAGAVVVTIRMRYFEELYHSIGLGKDATMALYREDGVLLASYPADTGARGGKFQRPVSLASAHASLPNSPFHDQRKQDIESRLSVLNRIAGFPLFMEVSIPDDTALAGWRKSAWVIGGGALFATMLLVFLVTMLKQQFARHEEDEERLRINEALLIEAQRIARVGSWSYRKAGRHMAWSPETYRILGFDKTTPPSPREILKSVHPDDKRRLLHAMSTAFQGGRADIELRIVRSFRGMRWAQFRAEPVFDARGKTDSLHGTILDLTERKRAESSRAQLAKIVESTDDAIISLSPDGTILSWNRGAERTFGHTAAGVIGKNYCNLMPPDQQADTFRLLELARSGRSIEHYETLYHTESGENIHIALTVSPIMDEYDRIMAASIIARDITAQKHAEEARRAADARLLRITANVPDVVFQFRRAADGSFSFTYISERVRDLYEECPTDALGNYMLLFSPIPRRHRYALAKSMLRSKRTGEHWSFETLIRCKSGKRKWIRGQASVSSHKDGSTFWDGVLSDITLQKRAAIDILTLNEKLERRVAERTRQLEAINKELEAFSYSVSHDLRTPLRAVEGFGRLLHQKYGDRLDAIGNDYLNRVLRASRRMNELVDDLLKLAQISRSEIRSETVDLSALAHTVIGALADAAPGRTVDVDIEDGIIINGDLRLLRVVLENLLGNAWKFTQKVARPRISLGKIVQDGNNVVFVRDNGAGFEMERAQKLFGAFQRLHRAADFEGTGIGLATVQRIITLHGGKVWAESIVNQGATFYFTL